MKQHEAVIEALKASGGLATLGQLYQTVLKIPDCKWGTKTPFASIRRIVQTYPEFFKVRPGLWALTSERERLLKELGISLESPTTTNADFNHSYYQGLIAQIGNLEGYETFVPNQDKNKFFLRHKLSDIASLAEYHAFTYESLVRQAKTIDVTWFNQRRMPKAFFEVEHSTDIQNSLRKFVAFQDFRMDFYIVADSARCKEFEAKRSYEAFTAVRDEVKFVDYETISEMHSRISASVASRKFLGLLRTQ